MFTIEAIREAQRRIEPYIYKTPLLRLENLDEPLGCQVYAKMESLQRTNSFKVRGAFNKLLTLSPEELKNGVVTASSGNHGKATAFAAKMLGISAHVVVPDSAPAIKVDGIRSYGAEVIFSEHSQRFIKAEKLAEENGWRFISPFDDYDIIAGQGTAALEIITQMPGFDYLLSPVGGGGLIGGLSTAVKETAPNVKVIGAEPAGVARYTKSFAAGHPVTLGADSKSVADGLQTLRPGIRNYPIVQKYVDGIVTVDDEYILKAAKLMLTRGKLLAEISSCITMGAVLQGTIKFKRDDKVVFFISGGNIDIEQIRKFEGIPL